MIPSRTKSKVVQPKAPEKPQAQTPSFQPALKQQPKNGVATDHTKAGNRVSSPVSNNSSSEPFTNDLPLQSAFGNAAVTNAVTTPVIAEDQQRKTSAQSFPTPGATQTPETSDKAETDAMMAARNASFAFGGFATAFDPGAAFFPNALDFQSAFGNAFLVQALQPESEKEKPPTSAVTKEKEKDDLALVHEEPEVKKIEADGKVVETKKEEVKEKTADEKEKKDERAKDEKEGKEEKEKQQKEASEAKKEEEKATGEADAAKKDAKKEDLKPKTEAKPLAGAEAKTTEEIEGEPEVVKGGADAKADKKLTKAGEGGEAGPGTGGGLAPEVQEWSKQVGGEIKSVPRQKVVAGAQGSQKLQQTGQKMTKAYGGAGGGAAKQVKPKKPEPPAPPQTVPPKPDHVSEATDLVVAQSKLRIPPDTMPPIEKSPQGNITKPGDMPVAPPPKEPPAGEVGPDGKPVEAGSQDKVSKKDPKVEEAKNKSKKKGEKVKKAGKEKGEEPVAKEEADPLALEDKGPPARQELPPPFKFGIGSVVSQLLTDTKQDALAVIDNARKSAYRNEALHTVNATFGNEWLGEIQQALDYQLRGIAREAGVKDEELESLIKKRRDELEKRRAEAAGEAATTATAAKEEVKNAGKESRDKVSTAKKNADKKVDKKVEETRDPNDPAVITEQRDAQLKWVYTEVARLTSEYKNAGEERGRLLTQNEYRHVLAYKRALQLDEEKIKAAHPEVSTPHKDINQGDLLLGASRIWEQGQERAVHKIVLDKKETAKGVAKTNQSQIRDAGKQAQEVIRNWAANRLQKERGYLTRFIEQMNDWAGQAKADIAVQEAEKNQQLGIAIAVDMSNLDGLLAKVGQDADLEAIEKNETLSEVDKAILRAYFTPGPDAKNPITAVAAGLKLRISKERQPALVERMEAKVIETFTNWKDLNTLGASQTQGFNAKTKADAIYGAMDQWGTEEDVVYDNLAGLTKIQLAAVRLCYKQDHHRDMEDHIKSEFSGSEEDRAIALARGDSAKAEANALYYAMKGGITGWGTDEDQIWKSLRNKTEEERRAIDDEYFKKTGRHLKEDMKDELGEGHEQDRGNALLEGDTAKADAIAIDAAMRGTFWGLGLGTDRKAIEDVYEQNKKEVEAAAANHPEWSYADIQAEVKRRNADVEASFNNKYAAEYGALPGQSALRLAYKEDLSGDELDLVNGLANNDMLAVDVARIEIERKSLVYASDDAINAVLRDQANRAEKELRRDWLREAEKKLDQDIADAKKAGKPLSLDEIKKRKHQLQVELELKVRVKGKENMNQLEKSYGLKAGVPLKYVIALNMSGEDKEIANKLVERGGWLKPEEEIHYAVDGLGTDKDSLKKALAGRTATEIEAIRKEYRKKYGEEMDDDIMGDVSGNDEFDFKELLVGEPMTAQEEMAALKRRYDHEKTTYGFWGKDVSETERANLDREFKDTQERFDKLNNPNLSVAERNKLQGEFEQQAVFTRTASEDVRNKVDREANTISQIGAVIAAVVVIVVAAVVIFFSGGTAAAPIVTLLGALKAALASTTVGAIAAGASLAATVGTKLLLKGGAYGWEEIGTDLAVGVVDIAATVLTAGLGAKLTSVARAAKGARLAKMAASPSKGARVLAGVLSEGVEGLAQSLPSAIVGTVADERNLQGDIFSNVSKGIAMQAGIGVGLSAGLGGISGLANPQAVAKGAKAQAANALKKDLTAVDKLAMWKAFKEANPGSSMKEFLRAFEAGEATKFAEEAVRKKAMRELRGAVLDGLPENMRKQFANTPIEVMSEADFVRFTRGKSGAENAALLIEDGKTRIIMRENANLSKLREEGAHLAQTVDPEWAPRIRELDEARMAVWDQLPLHVQTKAYRIKLDVEIDGQKRLLARLQALLAEAGDDPALRASLLDEIEDVTLNAKNLRMLREQAKDIPLSDRLLIGLGMKKKPDFLDKPPRLFSMTPRKAVPVTVPAKTQAPAKPKAKAKAKAKPTTQKEIEKEARAMYRELEARGYGGKFDRAEFIRKYKAGEEYDPDINHWRDRFPARKAEEKFPELTPGQKPPTPEQVLETLKRGTVDPSVKITDETAFQKWIAMVERLKLAKETDLVNHLKTIPAASRKLRDVRHELKERYAKKILDRMTDDDILKEKYFTPKQWKADPVGCLTKARYMALMDVIEELDSADKGNLAEKWYKKLFMPNAAAHVTVTVADFKRLGFRVDIDRAIDLLEGTMLREVKTIVGKLGKHDLEQFEDFMKLISKKNGVTVNVRGVSHTIKEARYVFTVPSSVKANVETLKDWLKDNPNLTIEIFNVHGQKKIIGLKGKTLPGNDTIEPISFLDKKLDDWLDL